MQHAIENNDKKIDLFLLPELSPLGYSEDTFARFIPMTLETRTLLAKIDIRLREVAIRMKAAICYGKIGLQENSSKITIRQVVVDKDGEEIAAYDKIHVCDYGDCAETRFFTPGKIPCSFTIQEWKFGLIICADMRYPQLAQNLVRDHGAHVLLQPASFSRDCSFRTWKSFRETRAVECGTYFLANNYAGEYFGQSSFNPPWIDENHEPTVLGTDVSYIVETLYPKILEEARTQFPFYRHTIASKACPSCGKDCIQSLHYP